MNFSIRNSVRYLFIPLFLFPLQGLAMSAGTEENATNTLLSYSRYSTELLNTKGKPSPFSVVVDGKRIGHLVARVTLSKEYPRQIVDLDLNGISPDWETRTSIVHKGIGWKIITLEDAKALWGTPRHHNMSDFDCYTFDASGKLGEENNIYHLDLQFKNQTITKYRIRGIGICNAVWVSQEDLEKNKKNN